MNFKKHIILLLFVFATFGVYAQTDRNEKIAVSLNAAYHKNFSGGVSLMYVPDFDRYACKFLYDGIFIGSDVVFDKNLIFVPKIGGQITAEMFCLRISELNYIHSQKADIRLLPEIGIEFRGYFNICYGYNIHIAGKKYDEMSSHRVTLTANLFFDKPKKKKYNGYQ